MFLSLYSSDINDTQVMVHLNHNLYLIVIINLNLSEVSIELNIGHISFTSSKNVFYRPPALNNTSQNAFHLQPLLYRADIFSLAVTIFYVY